MSNTAIDTLLAFDTEDQALRYTAAENLISRLRLRVRDVGEWVPGVGTVPGPGGEPIPVEGTGDPMGGTWGAGIHVWIRGKFVDGRPPVRIRPAHPRYAEVRAWFDAAVAAEPAKVTADTVTHTPELRRLATIKLVREMKRMQPDV